MIKHLCVAVCVCMLVVFSEAGTSSLGWGDDEGVSLVVVRQADETETPVEWACLYDPLKLVATVSGLDGEESVAVTIYDDDEDVGELDSEGNIHWKEFYTPTLGRHKFKAKAVFSATGRSDLEKWSDEVEVLIFRINIEFFQGDNALAEDDEGSEGSNEIMPGGFVGLNDNDDDGDGIVDSEDSSVAGEHDMTLARISFEPEVPGDGAVRLGAVFSSTGGRVRAWTKESKQDEINLSDSPIWYTGQNTFPMDVYIEGTVTSSEMRDITLTADYFSEAEGGIGSSDSAKVTVIRVNLDIKYLLGGTLSQEQEHGNGSICKSFVSQLDSPADKSDWCQVGISNLYITPSDAASSVTLHIRHDGPQSSVAGKASLLKNGVVALPDDSDSIDISAADLAASWRAEGHSPGVVDFALTADIGDFEVHRDQVRLSVSYVKPNPNGAVRLVNSGGELDVTRYGWKAYTKIADAIAVGSDKNVGVARGTYTEHSLAINNSLLVVGLGGAYDPSPGSWTKFDGSNIPKLNGSGAGSIFVISNASAELACLNVNDGKAALGGGICVWRSAAAVSFCELSNNHTSGSSGGFVGYGAAIYSEDSTVSLVGDSFVSNVASVGGGGAYFYKSVANVSTCKFDSNEAYSYGGAIVGRDTDGNAAISVRSSLFSGNKADAAGGGVALIGESDDTSIFAVANPPNDLLHLGGGANGVIKDCEFSNNRTSSQFNEVYGGAVFAFAKETKISISTTLCLGNSSQGEGGGVSTMGYATAVVSHCSFLGNVSLANDGGAGSHGTVSKGDWTYNRIENNTCRDAGGAIHASVRSVILVSNNDVLDNVCGAKGGGGFYARNSYIGSNGGNRIEGNVSAGSGGGLYCAAEVDTTAIWIATAHLKAGDTVRQNTAATDGGGVYVGGDIAAQHSTCTINDATFDRNVGGLNTTLTCTASGLFIDRFVSTSVANTSFVNHSGFACVVNKDYTDCALQGLWRNNNGGVLLYGPDRAGISYSYFDDNIRHVEARELLGHTNTLSYNTFTAGSTTVAGIWVDQSDAKIQITQNNFIGHKSCNAVVASIGVSGNVYGWKWIDATNNWWNSALGPNDPAPPGSDGYYNVNAAGDDVSNYVDYTGWATAKF